MDKLLAQVRRAHRRLVAEQFIRWLVVCLFVTLAIASIAIAVPQFVAIEGLPTNWAQLWIATAGLGSVLAAVFATWITRRSSLEAAMEIDRRFGLRERVASSLALAPADIETPAGKALLNDAARRVERIDVAEKFRPQPSRRAWLPLLPAVAVFCLVMFGENRQAISKVEEPTSAAAKAQVKKATDELQKKLAEKQKQADKRDLKGAEEVFRQLSDQTKELNNDDAADRKKATVKLNNLAKQLEARRAKLGSADELQKQMEKMKQFGKGPAEKVTEALKQGDWKKAMQELKQLQNKLAGDKLSQEDQEKLANQLEQMKNKIAEATAANREAMEKLKKQIEEQQKKGDLAKAGQLQQKLDQMMQKQPQMQNLDKLAQKLQEAQQAMQAGDKQGAAQAMQALADQLDQMKQEMDEMEMLDEALAQLDMAKNAMGCQQCSGEGCQACGGGGDQFAEGPPGNGMGAGRGKGPRPDEENPTQFRNSRVRQKPGQGAATFGGFVDGPNMKGETAAAIEEELAAIKSEPADPLTSQRLPRAHGQHAEEFFEKLREL